MFFFFETDGTYINTVGVSPLHEENEISQLEYEELCALLNEPPIAPVGKKYKLRLDKQWELVEE